MSAIDRTYSFAAPATLVPHEAAPGAVIDLRGIGGTLLRCWYLILLPMLLIGGLALAVVLVQPPRYESTAKVLLNPRGIQVLQNDLRPTNPTGDETGADVESQIQVAASANLLRKVIAELNLTQVPDFAKPQPNPIARLFEDLKGLFVAPPAGRPEDVMQTTLRTLQNALSVRRSEKSFVLDISVQTRDPDLSARVANAVAAAFVRETSEVRSETERRSGAELTGRLDQLRERLQKSEGEVAAYRRKIDLLNANGRPINEQQLAELTTQMMLTRVRVTEQAARLAAIKRMTGSGASPEALTEVTNSPTVSALRTQYADATRVEAEARMNYGSRHPSLMAAEKQVQTLRQRIAEEVGRLSRAAENDYDRARAGEDALSRRIETFKREMNLSNDAQVRLRELERQAASDRTLYENFLNRAKDLEERQALRTGGDRIITQAVPAIGLAGTSRGLIVLGGLVFGAAMGVGLALLRAPAPAAAPRGHVPPRAAPGSHLPVLAMGPGGDGADPSLWRMRRLLTPVEASGPARVVLVVGSGAAGPRMRLAHHLAETAQSEGERTVLIDGDIAGRALTKSLRAEHMVGLTDILSAASRHVTMVSRTFNGLSVVTAGTLDARAVRPSARDLRVALDTYVNQTGLVVVDGGSVSRSLREFAVLADDILIVVEGGPTALAEADQVLQGLGSGSNRVRGIILVPNPTA